MLLLAVPAFAPWVGTTASAASGNEVFVSATNEPDGPYNPGTLIFDSATALWLANQETVHGNQLDFSVNDGTNGIHVTLTAPNGSALQPGKYDHTISGANDAGQPVDGSRPGLNVVEGDTTCDEEEGSFDLHSLTVDSQHRLTSLWVTFRMRCLIPDRAGYLVGEVRWNVPGDGGSAVVGPQEIMWPEEETDAVPLVAPVTVFNPSSDPVQLATASVTGTDAADDTIASDGCSGTTLAPGDTCQVGVSYKASTAGDNHATLHIPEVGGPDHAVALNGSVFSGTTEYVIQSDPGDWLGGGQNYDFHPGVAEDFIAEGDSNYHSVGVGWDGEGGPGEWPGFWSVGFSAPRGEALTAGQSYKSGIWAQSPGRGCSTETGTFTIGDIAIDKWGDVQRLAASFDVHCDTSTGDLHGTIDYHENAINVSVRNGSVVITGQVAPNEPGKPVQIQVDKKRGGRYVLVHEKGLKLDHASSYRTSTKRVRAKTCRAIAVFKSKNKHLASRTVKRFHC